MARYRSLARSGNLATSSELRTMPRQVDYPTWAELCAPKSNYRKFSSGLLEPSGSYASFVSDHVQAMDMCQHPQMMPFHGFTSWCARGPQRPR